MGGWEVGRMGGRGGRGGWGALTPPSTFQGFPKTRCLGGRRCICKAVYLLWECRKCYDRQPRHSNPGSQRGATVRLESKEPPAADERQEKRCR